MNLSNLLRVFLFVCLLFNFSGCARNSLSAQSETSANPRESLIKAMRAKLSAKSYRMKVFQSSTNGMNSTLEVDYVAPDRFRMIAEMNFGSRSSEKLEMIIILGTGAYTKTPDGKWQQTKVDPRKMELTRLRDQMLIDSLSKAQDADVKFIGEVKLDGMSVFVYQHSFTGTPDIPAQSQTKTWVGVENGLPYRIEIDAEIDYQGKPISVKTTTIYYDYNADIKIEAPM